jgi:hypothetical protein
VAFPEIDSALEYLAECPRIINDRTGVRALPITVAPLEGRKEWATLGSVAATFNNTSQRNHHKANRETFKIFPLLINQASMIQHCQQTYQEIFS